MIALVGLFLAQSPKPLAELPFELVDNHISVPGSLNGKPIDALIDSGCSTSVADAAFATAAGAKKLESIGAAGASGDSVQAWTVSGLVLTLTGTKIQQSIPAIVPLASSDVAAGRSFPAILGTDFLQRYRVEIDYAASRLRIYAPSVSVVPPGATVLPLRLVGDLPYVEGAIQFGDEPATVVTMLVDTGDDSAFSVTRRLSARLGLDKRYADVPELPSAVGVGGTVREKEVRLRSVSLGSLRLTRPVADLQMDADGVNGSEATHDVSIGGEALRRFTVTLDYAHKRMILEPNSNLSEPFVGTLFGLGFSAKVGGGVEVKLVYPSSPASEAGIVVGDEILEIDGRPLTSLQKIRRLTSTQVELRLRIRHAGVEREVVLKPRELVP